MKTTRLISSLCGLVMAGLLSCSEEIQPDPFTYSQVFSGKISKTWEVRSISYIEKDKQDQFLSLPACIADDEYIFYAKGEKKYEVRDGINKCNAGDPDLIVSDTWSFVNATASLTIILPFLSDFPLPYIVKHAGKNVMELEIYIDEAGTKSYRIKFSVVSEK